MGSLTRQAKSLSGMLVGFIVVAIIAFFVLNFWQTHGGPVAGVGGWLFSHASGEAYGGGAAAPSAPAMSAYSQSNNLGPQL